ncbi:MAG: hypothetical protein IRZ18_05450, partial [Clostridia bacterium]|nr:hypothetical protein [Clostridia bacterium]
GDQALVVAGFGTVDDRVAHVRVMTDDGRSLLIRPSHGYYLYDFVLVGAPSIGIFPEIKDIQFLDSQKHIIGHMSVSCEFPREAIPGWSDSL